MEDKITLKLAVQVLNELIADREKEMSDMPLFMEDEIENLQKEVNSYRKHLQKLEGGDTSD